MRINQLTQPDSFASLRVTTIFYFVRAPLFSFSVFVSIIIKMPLSLRCRIHRPGENLLPTHSHIPLHRTSIQRSCRLGNGFLTIVVDRFRGFKAKRTDLKSSETRGQNPSKPLNIHPRHNSPIIMTSSFPPRWTHDRKVGGSNPTCATIWAFLVRFQSSFSRSSSSFNKY